MSRTKKRVSIALLVLMATFLMADQQLLPPNYPEIMKEFSISESSMGLVSTVYVAVAAFVTIVWGLLSDVQDRKKLLVVGVLVGEIPCFLTAFVQSYPQLLLVRFFTGIGVGSIFPIGFSLISDMFDESQRGRGFSFIQAAFGLGTLFGMAMAGFIASWRTPFIIVSVPNFVLAPLFYVVHEEPSRGEGDEEVRDMIEEGHKYEYNLSLDTVKESFTTRTNVLVFTQGVMGTVPWGVITFWLIAFLRKTRGMSKTTATLVLLVVGLVAIVGTFVGGFAGDYFEEKRSGGRALLVSAAIFIGMAGSIGLILYPFPSQPSLVVWIALIIYSLVFLQFISFGGPNVPAIMSQVNPPEDRGTIFGVSNLINNGGRALGPVFGGILIEFINGMGYTGGASYKYALIISALFWIPAALIWLWIAREYPRDRNEIKDLLRTRKETALKGSEKDAEVQTED